MKKVAIFDFNGTLIDDTEIWWDCVIEIFKKDGFTENFPSVGEFIEMLTGCNGIIAAYRAFGIGLSEQDINSIFVKTYLGLASNIVIEPETLEVLEILKRNGVVCAIVSWHMKNLLTETLYRSGGADYFKYIVAEAYDKASAIRHIRAAEKTEPDDCYYIGDLPTDIDYGRQAGVKSIALLIEWVPEHLIEAKRPDYKIRHLGELPKIIIG